MNRELLFEQLKEALERCGISLELRNLADDEVDIESGLCDIDGRRVLIVDRRLGIEGRIGVIVKSLKGQNMENIFMPPALRELIDNGD